ncbi:hypothetical protein RvY_04089 [Ramazzottius varieornatus]|uniref:AB hydrolase-1 domain-containing protein n=1 Tax=Ramazzottius varieornatus TaxID=947166 RepID=A0A1D1UR52_RAMVA|nr:hypothetical protein RvY_04089 [Ramazzottius varieornatus]
MADNTISQTCLKLRTTRCGEVDVHVLGDIQQVSNRVVFLTVHDFGSNAHSFDRFVLHESMQEVRSRSVWLNVEVPGQGINSPDLPSDYKFPSLQEIGEDVVEILNLVHVQYVVGFGEGAGANILTRFAMTYPNRVLGLILIHPTATSAGIQEWFKEKWLNFTLKSSSSSNPSAEDYLVMYKFGNDTEGREEGREQAIKQYLAELRSRINHKNLQLYMDAFSNRNDITTVLKDKLTCDVLIICGNKSSFQHTVVTMYSHLNPQKASLLNIDNVGDALNEAPAQVTRGLVLFCKGLGLLTSVTTPGERARSSTSLSGDGGAPRRRVSMQEADLPRRISVTAQRPPETSHL